MKITGKIVGYDPGGNSSHGLAIFDFHDNFLINNEIMTLKTADDVINKIQNINDLLAIGIDTLTCWSTGHSGWRPADRWLKKKYKEVNNSIASANSLFGSTGLNGMSVLFGLRSFNKNIEISETHPKVLYYALAGRKYDHSNNHQDMDKFISQLFDKNLKTNNDHEWDAVISVYAALNGLIGNWNRNLHLLPNKHDERIIEPCGKTQYWWPS